MTAASFNVPTEMESQLDTKRHVKYWTRCLKTFLPHEYTGTSSNRMYLAFLTISALDLLGSLTAVSSEVERRDYINWIYHLQHPEGGFRGFLGTDFEDRANEANAVWDPANLPAAYFALTALLMLGDDFKRIKRRKMLQWLVKMQREDGTFGEYRVDGKIEGGRDPRSGFCAAGIRYMLRGTKALHTEIEGEQVKDIDIDALVRSLRDGESPLEGGMADEPLHETHAGYTYCSLGALNLVGRLKTNNDVEDDPSYGPRNPEEVVRWLVYRQTDALYPDPLLDSEFLVKRSKVPIHEMSDGPGPESEPAFQRLEDSVVFPRINTGTGFEGMNGRPNKVADTCYAWWVIASLHILGKGELYDRSALRMYLLEKAQHPVLGGFGKFPGDLPDLYHSSLGLAALSLIGDSNVKDIDPGMCISKEAKARLQGIWNAWESEGT